MTSMAHRNAIHIHANAEVVAVIHGRHGLRVADHRDCLAAARVDTFGRVSISIGKTALNVSKDKLR
jgi:hypothetical protein